MREAGARPARTRRCDRGRRLREATASSLAGRRSRRTIREPEDLPPECADASRVVNGTAAAHAVASNTGGPGQTQCRPGLCRLGGREAGMRAAVTGSGRRRAPGRRAPAPARAASRPGRVPLVGRPGDGARRCSSRSRWAPSSSCAPLHVAPYVFPPPSAVLAELAADPLLFARAALVTVSEAAAGLALGAALALAFAAAATHSRRARPAAHARSSSPSQTVPVIALAPLLVLWMGYGAPPKVVVCALIAFFPMAVTAREGLRATDPQLLLLMRSVGASRRDVFWRVRMPFALPYPRRRRAHRHHAQPGRRGRRRVDGRRQRPRLPRASRQRAAGDGAGVRRHRRHHRHRAAAYAAAALLERRLCWWTPVPRKDPREHRSPHPEGTRCASTLPSAPLDHASR